MPGIVGPSSCRQASCLHCGWFIPCFMPSHGVMFLPFLVSRQGPGLHCGWHVPCPSDVSAHSRSEYPLPQLALTDLGLLVSAHFPS